MANNYAVGFASGKKVSQTYEQGLASLADKSKARENQKKRMRLAMLTWNACSKYGMRGMEGATFLKCMGFTDAEIKATVKAFLNA
jgi:hypothetical protein